MEICHEISSLKKFSPQRSNKFLFIHWYADFNCSNLLLALLKLVFGENTVGESYNVILIVVFGSYDVFAVHMESTNAVCSAYVTSANTDKDSVNACKIMI